MLGRVKRAEGANPPADYAEGVQMGAGVIGVFEAAKKHEP